MAPAQMAFHLPPSNPLHGRGISYAYMLCPEGVFRILIGVAISAVIIISAMLMRWWIPLPQHLVALAVVRGGTNLPQAFPSIWREELRTSQMPIFLGLARTSQRIEPFVVSCTLLRCTIFPRHLSPSPRAIKSGESSAHVLTWNRLAWISGLVFSPAYLRLDTHEIHPSLQEIVSGPINAFGQWKTNIRLPDASSFVSGLRSPLPQADIALDLERLPEAWPLLLNALRPRGIYLDILEKPSSVGLTFSSSSAPEIELHFAQGYATSTATHFAAAMGIFSTLPYRLADETVVEELRLPEYADLLLRADDTQPTTTRKDAYESTKTQEQKGRRLDIAQDMLAIRMENLRDIPSSTKAAVQSPDGCVFDRPIARFSSLSLDRLAELMGFVTPQSFRTLSIGETAARVWVCVH